jgi:hypothetical protein
MNQPPLPTCNCGWDTFPTRNDGPSETVPQQATPVEIEHDWIHERLTHLRQRLS